MTRLGGAVLGNKMAWPEQTERIEDRVEEVSHSMPYHQNTQVAVPHSLTHSHTHRYHAKIVMKSQLGHGIKRGPHHEVRHVQHPLRPTGSAQNRVQSAGDAAQAWKPLPASPLEA